MKRRPDKRSAPVPEEVITMTRKVLLVEDEAPVRAMLKYALEDEDYQILEASDAIEGFLLMERHRPDLILLDWMLPGMSGLEFARRLRKDAANRATAIIMLTARAEEADRIMGLKEADDYVTKPFSTLELKARMENVLRWFSSGDRRDIIQFGGLRLDPVAHQVTLNGEPAEFGPTEFRLLYFFMMHPERVYTREQLLNHVWQNSHVEERTVDVHIRRLRKVLTPHGFDRHIQTVRTVGYRFWRAPSAK
jgi:two-component system phosphate regulon response regulator PhoB